MSGTCPICGSASAKVFRSRFEVPLLTCSACGARYVSPAPSSSDLRRRYEREHAAGAWSELMDRGPQDEPRRRAALIQRISRPSGSPETPVGRAGLLLDVGFGDGRFLDAAHQAGWECVGIEIAWSAATAAAPRHPVAVADLEALADTEIFDAVCFWDVLEHVRDPGAGVASAVRRLRPGGLLAASMPSLVSTTARVEGAGWRYYDLDTYGHLVHLSPRHLEALLSAQGLDIVYAETRGSVDLRDSLAGKEKSWTGVVGWLLDRLSGVLARAAIPLGFGNTMLVVGRKKAASKPQTGVGGTRPPEVAN